MMLMLRMRMRIPMRMRMRMRMRMGMGMGTETPMRIPMRAKVVSEGLEQEKKEKAFVAVVMVMRLWTPRALVEVFLVVVVVALVFVVGVS